MNHSRTASDQSEFSIRNSLLRAGFLLVFFLVLATGCDSGTPADTPPQPELREVGVVLNSVEETLTVFDPGDPDQEPRTVELEAGGDGTPVGLAVRDGQALVPMGVFPAAQVVDLAEGQVVRSIALPTGSGATGSVFLTDSTALVANPGLGTVAHVNVRTGMAMQEIQVGRFPQGFVHAGDRVAVINAELENFSPVGPGTLTVLDAEDLSQVGVVTLSGLNPSSGVVTSGGRVFVLNGGTFGGDNGSISEVDLTLLAEVAHHPGFGDFPMALTLAEGLLHAASWSFGVIAWNPDAGSFVRGPDNAVEPQGVSATSGLGVDQDDRLYALFPDCENPSRVLRLGADFSVRAEFPAGICPTGLAFTQLEVD